MKEYNFWTDGAASMKNLNGEYIREAGGWAWVLVENDKVVGQDCGREDNTTNNRMELMAIYNALNSYFRNRNLSDNCEKASKININTDSAYCINIFTNWVEGWKANGWRRGKKKEPIENVELIIDIYNQIKILKEDFTDVNFIKVKGHSGDKWNEYVDKMAVEQKDPRYSNEDNSLMIVKLSKIPNKIEVTTHVRRELIGLLQHYSKEELNEIIEDILNNELKGQEKS